MLTKTNYTVDSQILQEALESIPSDNFRFAINRPIGDFFYDPWELKAEFCNTVWEQIYNSLPVANKGEARLINLLGASCYASHADADDRYHLNLSGNHCCLINLDQNQIHEITNDGIWYTMNAGFRHVAANFGNRPRYQLVVRHLFKRTILTSSVSVVIQPSKYSDIEDARFQFDDRISPWVNQTNKQGNINNFNYDGRTVTFDVNSDLLDELKSLMPIELELSYDN